MCGFAGIFNWTASEDEWIETLGRMGHSIQHRGPDHEGYWIDQAHRIGIAHQRLSILDLSSNAKQPMISKSKNLVIAFNGELYNFKDLRSELQSLGHLFKSKSDTEVVIEAIEKWGLSNALSKFNGMFAFSLYDKRTQTLFLVRDRFGEKPLYWGNTENTFIFASELRAFKYFSKFKTRFSEEGLRQYKGYGYFPNDITIFDNAFKLLPGKILSISKDKSPKIEEYYSLRSTVSSRKILKTTLRDATDELDQRLKKIIGRQLVADVPVGCFLSSGIDSALISAIAQQSGSEKVKTFSVGFKDSQFDESNESKKIASYLKTEHTTLIVSENDALNIIPDLGKIYDEPFADSSQIPTILISKIIKDYVKVALSGDGGDELFGGYNRHLYFSNYWPPSPLQKTVALGFDKSKFFKLLSNKILKPRQKDLLQKFIEVSKHSSIDSAYNSLTGFSYNSNLEYAHLTCPNNLSDLEKIIYWDQLYYLPNDILVKVDRAAMSQGLEVRIPFLDHELVSWSWSLSEKLKINKNETKMVARNLLKKYIPENLISRSKKGFAVPLSKWMIGPLRGLIEDSFNKSSDIIIEKKELLRLWNSFTNGNTHLKNYLWSILIFELWIKNFSLQHTQYKATSKNLASAAV